MKLTKSVSNFYRLLTDLTWREYDPNNLSKSTIVFSPHQDDETLGCGGTIFLKKQAQADLKIVFMTDGSRSHASLVPENELKSIRKQEAIAAAKILGVAEQDVIFLDFPDGTLSQNQEDAILKVIKLLEDCQPEEIFIPYDQEQPADHWSTNTIVVSAIKTSRLKTTIYEYPIWFWHQWPWVSLTSNKQKFIRKIKNTLKSKLGLDLITKFKCSVDIRDILEIKRAALAQHKSQVQRLIPNPNWLTLGDIENGEFLDCFFQGYEVFRKTRI